MSDDRVYHASAVRNAYGSRTHRDADTHIRAGDRSSQHDRQEGSHTGEDRWRRGSVSRSPSRKREDRERPARVVGRQASTSPLANRARRAPSSLSSSSPTRSPSPTRSRRDLRQAERAPSPLPRRRSPSSDVRRQSQSHIGGYGYDRDLGRSRHDERSSQRHARPASPGNPLKTDSRDRARDHPSVVEDSNSARIPRQLTPDTPPLQEEPIRSSTASGPSVEMPFKDVALSSRPRRGRTPTGPRSEIARHEQSPQPLSGMNIPTGPAADRRDNAPILESASSRNPAAETGALNGARNFVSIALPKKTPTQPRRDRLLATQHNEDSRPMAIAESSPSKMDLLDVRQHLRTDASRYSQLLQQAPPYMRMAMNVIQKKDPTLEKDVIVRLREIFQRDPKDHEIHAIGTLYRQLKNIKSLEERERELAGNSDGSAVDVGRNGYRQPETTRHVAGDESPTKGLRSGGWTSKRATGKRSPSPNPSRGSRRSMSPARPRSPVRRRDGQDSRSEDRNHSRYRSLSRSPSPVRTRHRPPSPTSARRSARRDYEEVRARSPRRNVYDLPRRQDAPQRETRDVQPPAPKAVPVLPEEPKVLRGKPYEKVVQVGEGTYGKVYKARNREGLGLVALKRIRMEGEKDGFPVTAMREIKLLQGLDHDNVIRLHEMMVSHG